jgi:hypothetical protein
MKRSYNAGGNQGGSAIDQKDAAKGECRVWGFDPDLAGGRCDRTEQPNTVKLMVRPRTSSRNGRAGTLR